MKKIFTLLILLLLLPVTALAARNDRPNSLYVGNTKITSAGYWTSSDDGTNWTSQQEKPEEDSYIYYDGDGTLTLHNVSIQGKYNETISGHGIDARSYSGSVSLSIVLEGKNNVSGMYGINVINERGNASLNIRGSGSLTVSGHSGNGIGIFVSANGDDTNLTIEGANVTASGNQDGGSGVQLTTSQTGSPNLTIAVKGGSLQASGKTNGINFFSNADDATAVANLQVSGNAMVKASNIITTKNGPGSLPELKPAASGSDGTGGIIWDGKNGTVYGNVTLQEDLEIGEGESLTIGDGASLDTNGKTITVESGGKLEGTPIGNGTVKIAPTITTTESLPDGEVGTVYSQTLTATGDPTITWNVTSGTLPAGLTLDTNTGTISGTPTTANTYNFTVTATNDSGNDSKQFSLTIDPKQTVSVTGVTLDQAELSLYTGESKTLIATVQPSDATIQNVTWSSDKPEVATVEDGKVTAVAEGEATITVTTEDGTFTATCKVTVTHSMVHTPKKDATCTADGNEEYWTCEICGKYFSDEAGTTEISLAETVIPATGHHYVNGTCTVCGEKDPDYRPDPISYYNIYVEDVCDGVEVTTSKNVVREGGSISVYVEKDTANYTFDNFKVYYKRSYYGTWDELKEGTQPGEYPIKNIWTHIYIKAEGAKEKEDPTGIESIEGVKVYTKDGSLYVQTPQREQVIIVSMSGAVVKNEEQVGLKQYHGLQPGIYIVRVGQTTYKLRLN